MPQACKGTRVIKKLSATQAGAIKLARRYGHALVCVRYRCDKEGLIRYTTVELLVEQAAIQKREKRKSALDIVSIPPERKDTADLSKRIRAHGGTWDRDAHVWRLPRGAAKRLGLLNRAVEK